MSLIKISCVLACVLLGACLGEYPEKALTDKAAQLWNLDELRAQVKFEQRFIDAPLEGLAQEGASQACKRIAINHFSPRDQSSTSTVDAHIVLMPGIYEGANSFNIIAREIVYQAQRFHAKHYQVWAMERRSNCLEDMHGFELAEQASSAERAKQIMIDYYYKQQPVEGRQFAGFLDQQNPKYLAEFGIEQATEDMLLVLNHVEPEQSVRQQKVFLGGHSLGAIHTSIFLSWDFDGSLLTLDDAGFNQVAGAISLDSLITPVNRIPEVIAAYFPGWLAALGLGAADFVTPSLYAATLEGLRNGSLPTTATLNGLFTSEIIALPEALGILASKAPQEENTAINEIPRSRALNNILKLLHFSGPQELLSPTPSALEYRYSNLALLGLFFDDDFSPIGFLGSSLGHLSNGPIRRKPQGIRWINQAPPPFPLLRGVLNTDNQYIASWPRNFPGLAGPLYQWADFEQVANQSDTRYLGIESGQVLTTATEEMVDINSFLLTLYEGRGNLTEWYFPMRLFVDAILAVPWEHGPDYGINSIHVERALSVPHIEFMSGEGIYIFLTDLLPLTANAIIVPGMHHLDPLYEVNGRPERHQAVVVPKIIEFVETELNATQSTRP